MISFIDMPQLVVESANLIDLTAGLLNSLGIIREKTFVHCLRNNYCMYVFIQLRQ